MIHQFFVKFLNFSSNYASNKLPRESWKMCMGTLWGTFKRSQLVIEEAFPLVAGTESGVVFAPEDQLSAIKYHEHHLESTSAGVISTRQAGHLILSDADIETLRFHAAFSNHPVSIKFDHTLVSPTSLGLAVYRFEDVNAKLPNEVTDIRLFGFTQELLHEAFDSLGIDPAITDSLWRNLPQYHFLVSDIEPDAPIPSPDPPAEEISHVWGFDPIKDHVVMESSPTEERKICRSDRFETKYYYEKIFTLKNDPELVEKGVEIGVHLSVGSIGEHPQNQAYIFLKRGNKESKIEIWGYEELEKPLTQMGTLNEKYLDLLFNIWELVPWKYFASLISFVTGLVTKGLCHTFKALPINAEGSISDFPYSIDTRIGGHFLQALSEVVPEVMDPFFLEIWEHIIEHYPTEWIVKNWDELEFSFKGYKIFETDVYLNRNRKKLIDLFQKLWEYHDLQEYFYDSAPNFLDKAFTTEYLESLDISGKIEFLNLFSDVFEQNYHEHPLRDKAVIVFQTIITANYSKLDAKLLQKIIPTINQGVEQKKVEGIFGKIFRLALAREDPLLLQYRTLEDLLTNTEDPLGLKEAEDYYDMMSDEYTDPTILEQTTPDFLSKLLETVFEIWRKDENPFLGDLPYILIRHFFAREGCSVELLTKLVTLAPMEWLIGYWERLDGSFDLWERIFEESGKLKKPYQLLEKKLLPIMERVHPGLFSKDIMNEDVHVSLTTEYSDEVEPYLIGRYECAFPFGTSNGKKSEYPRIFVKLEATDQEQDGRIYFQESPSSSNLGIEIYRADSGFLYTITRGNSIKLFFINSKSNLFLPPNVLLIRRPL